MSVRSRARLSREIHRFPDAGRSMRRYATARLGETVQVQPAGGRITRRAVVGGLARLGASVAGLAVVNGCGLLPFAPQPRVARIGWLWSGSQLSINQTNAYREGLRAAGWIEGQNLVIEERLFGGQQERIPDLAAELIAHNPDVLATGTTEVALALLRATQSTQLFGLALFEFKANKHRRSPLAYVRGTLAAVLVQRGANGRFLSTVGFRKLRITIPDSRYELLVCDRDWRLVAPANEWYRLRRGVGSPRTRETYLAMLMPFLGYLADRSWQWAAEPHLIRDYTRRFLVDSGCAIQRSRLDGWLIKAGSRSAYSPNALALFIAAARDFYTVLIEGEVDTATGEVHRYYPYDNPMYSELLLRWKREHLRNLANARAPDRAGIRGETWRESASKPVAFFRVQLGGPEACPAEISALKIMASARCISPGCCGRVLAGGWMGGSTASCAGSSQTCHTWPCGRWIRSALSSPRAILRRMVPSDTPSS
jgi:hypothetical protein